MVENLREEGKLGELVDLKLALNGAPAPKPVSQAEARWSQSALSNVGNPLTNSAPPSRPAPNTAPHIQAPAQTQRNGAPPPASMYSAGPVVPDRRPGRGLPTDVPAQCQH